MYFDCGFIVCKNSSSKLTLAGCRWACTSCYKYYIRDWNVAKNILAKGLTKIA